MVSSGWVSRWRMFGDCSAVQHSAEKRGEERRRTYIDAGSTCRECGGSEGMTGGEETGGER